MLKYYRISKCGEMYTEIPGVLKCEVIGETEAESVAEVQM